MNNQKQTMHSNDNSHKQLGQGQLSFPLHPLQYQIYSFYLTMPYYSIHDQFAINEGQFVKIQQPKGVMCNTVSTQTMEMDFLPQISRSNESLVSLVIAGNQVEKNKTVLVKEENQPQEHIKCVEVHAEKGEDSQSSSINKQQNFHNTINRNLKAKQQCLENLLQFYLLFPQKYSQTLQKRTKKQTLFSLVVRFFDSKICMFKKSKEEMIKLIIRKTQRSYKMKKNCKKDDRFKKYGGFKSMNSVYLEKLFSDTEFAEAFLSVMENFVQEFEKENRIKLEMFLTKMCAATSWEELKCAMKSLDEKNKMPWPTHWVLKLKKVIEELQVTYIDHQPCKVKSK